jgi:hypothetical protein
MNSPDTPVPRLVAIDRRQLLLRTADAEKLVEDGHAVRSIWELVGRLDLRGITRRSPPWKAARDASTLTRSC